MGISMVDCRVGTIVWVHRKNGTWWPGRVVGPNEVSHSRCSLSNIIGTPVKLLGKEDATVEWFNIEKSKRIKAFRCGEFDDCIGRAESSQVHPSRKHLKHAYREDAILHALELEKQKVMEKNKRPGQELRRAFFLGKRSKCVYLPAQSSNCLKSTIMDPQSSVGMVDCSFPSDSAGGNAFCRPTGSKSFLRESQTQEKDIIQISGRAESKNLDGYDAEPEGVNCKEYDQNNCLSDFLPKDSTEVGDGEEKRNVGSKLKIQFKRTRSGVVTTGWSCLNVKNGKHERADRRTDFATKSGEESVWEMNTYSQSALQGSRNRPLGSLDNDPQSMKQPKLIDVELIVQTSDRREHVPLISLMSKLSGHAIIGHPIKIEASEDNSLKKCFLKDDDVDLKSKSTTTIVTCVPVEHVFNRLCIAVGGLQP